MTLLPNGGLPALRKALHECGVHDPLWLEVPKSRLAPKHVRSALKQGADLIFVWGGDGMVQRRVDVVAGSDATMAIVPAGTANLFAANLASRSTSRTRSRSGCTESAGSLTWAA